MIANLTHRKYSSGRFFTVLLNPRNRSSWRPFGRATLAIPLDPARVDPYTTQSTSRLSPHLPPISLPLSEPHHRATPRPRRPTRRRSLRRTARGASPPFPTSPSPAYSHHRHGHPLLTRTARICTAGTQQPLCRTPTSFDNLCPSRSSTTTTKSTRDQETKRSSLVDGEDHLRQERRHLLLFLQRVEAPSLQISIAERTTQKCRGLAVPVALQKARLLKQCAHQPVPAV